MITIFLLVTLVVLLFFVFLFDKQESVKFGGFITSPISGEQPNRSYTISISDSTDLSTTVTEGVAVDVPTGSTCTIAFKLVGDSSATTRVLSSSVFLPGKFSRVMNTGTTLNSSSVTGYGA